MLFKIMWRSFFKQSRNYLVYFLCMVTSVMIFYSFSAMTYDQPLANRASQDIQISNVLTVGNVVVAMVVLLFMLNANQFFIQQRQKEIGLFRLFGIKKRYILLQFLVENFALNICSLLVGIAMGILFSKFFAMILVKAMALDITSHFVFSWGSIQFTIQMFLLATIAILIQNTWLIWNKQVLEMLSTKQNFAKVVKIHWINYIFAILSVVLIGLGYLFAYRFNQIITAYVGNTNDNLVVFWMPLLILMLCVLGTYLLMGAGLPVVLWLISKYKRWSYQDLHLFTLNDTRKLLNGSWRTLTWLTIVLSIAITIIGSTTGLFAYSYRLVNQDNPTDFQVKKADQP